MTSSHRLTREPIPRDIVSRGGRYIKAYNRWRKAGYPRRTPEHAAYLLTICQGCEEYTGDSCGVCGCSVGKRTILGDKLEWATEECPLGKF